MDNGKGVFKEIRFAEMTEKQRQIEKMREKYPKAKGIFEVGEKLVIRGSLFQVKDISPFGIKLKLLRQPEDSADFCQCDEPENNMVPYGGICVACGRIIRG